MAKYTGVTQNTDGSWTYRIKIKLPDGSVKDTRIKKDSRGNPFLTARQAFEAKKDHEARIRANPEESASKPKKVTLTDVYEHYLKTTAKEKAPATLRKKDSMWRNYVQKSFGDRDINSITQDDLDTFLLNVYENHSYAYTEGFLKFFYLLFGRADKMQVVNSDWYEETFINPNKRLTMPKKRQEDNKEDEHVDSYTSDEIEIIRGFFESGDRNLYIAFCLGLYAGLRISECFGLRWQDIDWNTNTIHVKRQLNYVDGTLRLTAVKTLKGVREVIMPTILYDELSIRRLLEDKQKTELGEAYRNTEKVYDEIEKKWITGGDFVNRKANGELLTVNSMKYWAKKITPALQKNAEKKAKFKTFGLPDDIARADKREFRYHMLRHTYASNCAAANVSMYKLMAMLGHKKIDTTMKYYVDTSNETLYERTLKTLDELFPVE